jgi:hypothetical protein
MLSLVAEEPKEMVLQVSGICLEKVWLKPEVACEVFLHLALENLSHFYCFSLSQFVC